MDERVQGDPCLLCILIMHPSIRNLIYRRAYNPRASSGPVEHYRVETIRQKDDNANDARGLRYI